MFTNMRAMQSSRYVVFAADSESCLRAFLTYTLSITSAYSVREPRASHQELELSCAARTDAGTSEKCRALEAEWDTAVATGTEQLVSFDCSENPEACREADVQASPEVHLFQDGKRIAKYEGPRRAAA
jgi:hypothetical protein